MEINLTDSSNATGAIAPTGAPLPDHEKLRALAAQFESMLLGQMMKEMRSSVLGEDDKETGFGENPLAGAMYSELSLALSRAGGIGIAQSMLGSLLKQADGSTGNLQLPPMSTPDPSTTGEFRGLAPSAVVAAIAGKVSSAYGWQQTDQDTPVLLPMGLALGGDAK